MNLVICVEDGIDSSKMVELRDFCSVRWQRLNEENILVRNKWKDEAERKGKWNGGFAPYGYELVNGELQITGMKQDYCLSHDKFISIPNMEFLRLLHI